MESTCFQRLSTPPPTKRKRLDDTIKDEVVEPRTTRKRPPSRLQLELGYNGTRYAEWNTLHVSISTNYSIYIDYTNAENYKIL